MTEVRLPMPPVRLIGFLSIALGLAAAVADAAPPRLVGYLPRYRPIRPAQFETLTHAIVFSVVPDPDTGTFKVFSENAETGEIIFEAPPGGAGLSSLMIDQAVAEAANYGCKVGLCIGGTAVHSQFQYLVINGKVNIFADHVRDFAVAHGIKEINIDWETPANQWDPGRAQQIFAALSSRLAPLGIELTAAWTSFTSKPYALEAARLCEPYTDAVYVMSYEAPLSNFQSRFQFYIKPVSQGGMGYPAAKVCPGIQFFGRDSARTLVKTYSQLVDLAGGDIDPALNSMVVEGKTLLFTGQDELEAMCAYTKQQGGGLMIWEIGQDSDPAHDDALIGVIHNELGITTNTATPHWWLRKHGITDDFDNAVLVDADCDTQITSDEYIADTDPLDPLDRLELTPLSDAIQFPTRPDRYYTLFASESLATGIWDPLDGYPVAGTGDPVILPYDPALSRCFFRLGVSLSNEIPVP